MSAYTYRKATNGYGWEIYCDGAWVGWTAGSREDAKQMIAELKQAAS